MRNASLMLFTSLMVVAAGCGGSSSGAPSPAATPAASTVVAQATVADRTASTTPASKAPTSTPIANAPAATPSSVPSPVPPKVLRVSSVTIATSPGSTATVVVEGAAPGASCSITVTYNSIPSTDPGLAPKQADANGRASWTWGVPTRTPPGDTPISITCGGVTVSTSSRVT